MFIFGFKNKTKKLMVFQLLCDFFPGKHFFLAVKCLKTFIACLLIGNLTQILLQVFFNRNRNLNCLRKVDKNKLTFFCKFITKSFIGKILKLK